MFSYRDPFSRFRRIFPVLPRFRFGGPGVRSGTLPYLAAGINVLRRGPSDRYDRAVPCRGPGRCPGCRRRTGGGGVRRQSGARRQDRPLSAVGTTTGRADLNELNTLSQHCVALLEALAEQGPGSLNLDQWSGIVATLSTREDLPGMRRAARELRRALDVLAPADRYALLQAVRSRTGGSLGQLDKPDRQLASKALSRRRIKNEEEFYALQSYLDSLNGDPAGPGKARKVAALLDRYRR